MKLIATSETKAFLRGITLNSPCSNSTKPTLDFNDLMDLTEDMLRKMATEVLGSTKVVNTVKDADGESSKRDSTMTLPTRLSRLVGV